jgi:hypothetical protein
MADVRLTPQDLSTTGATTTRTAISTGNTYKIRIPPGGVVLNWRKTGAGTATITIQTPGTVDGLAIAERTVSVPATTGDVWGAYKKGQGYDDSSGDLNFTTDEGTGLTCAVGQALG